MTSMYEAMQPSIQSVAASVKSAQTHINRATVADNVTLLSRLGLSPTEVILAVVAMSLRPASADMSQGGFIALVRGCQMHLRTKGYPVNVSGKLDTETQAALSIVAGTAWQTQTWQQIIPAVLGSITYDAVLALAAQKPGAPEKTPMTTWLLVGALGVGAFLYFQKGR